MRFIAYNTSANRRFELKYSWLKLEAFQIHLMGARSATSYATHRERDCFLQVNCLPECIVYASAVRASVCMGKLLKVYLGNLDFRWRRGKRLHGIDARSSISDIPKIDLNSIQI